MKQRYYLLMCFFVTNVFAAPKKPALLSAATADTTKQDSILKSVFQFLLDLSIYGSLAAIVIGLVLMTPFLGKKDEGMKGIKGGGLLFLIAILFDSMILPLLSKFF